MEFGSSVHIGKGPSQGLDDATITAEAKYTINFTESGKRFVFRLHYNGSNSFMFVNTAKIYQFTILEYLQKTKTLEITFFLVRVLLLD